MSRAWVIFVYGAMMLGIYRPGSRLMSNMTVNENRGDWLSVLRTYVVLIAATNLIWEVGQLPLYTIWRDGTARDIVIAVLHCTIGDVIIAVVTFVLAIALIGDGRWPSAGFGRVLAVAVCFGVLYTVFSEWLNVVNRKTWTYSDNMIMVP